MELKVQSKIQNFQEKKNLQDLGLGKKFLNFIPKGQSIKRNIDKLDPIKIKTMCFMKEPVKKMKI